MMAVRLVVSLDGYRVGAKAVKLVQRWVANLVEQRVGKKVAKLV